MITEESVRGDCIPEKTKPETAPSTIDTYKPHVVRSAKRKAPAAKRMHFKQKAKAHAVRRMGFRETNTKAPAVRRTG